MDQILRTTSDELRRAGASPTARLVVLGLAIVVNIGFFLPRLPDVGPVASVPSIDKIVHIGVFALTAWALGRVLAPRRRFPMGWVVVGLLAWAVLVEVIQGAVLPGRLADPWDVVADAVGIGLGVLAWSLERWYRAGPPVRHAPADHLHPRETERSSVHTT
ncbi:MAG: VanZ family protein [Brachybacterium sp.]|nr:VanZ family protein [Brachybacterium sp.]